MNLAFFIISQIFFKSIFCIKNFTHNIIRKMETLKEIIPKIKYIKTNIDGSSDSYDYLTLLDLYNIAEPKLGELCSKYDIINFELPKISGYNSLVIYADSKNHKFAIKINVNYKKNLGMIDTIYKHVSENLISPKIYYDDNIEYNSAKYIVKITVTEKLILFSDFKWESLEQIKNSIEDQIDESIASPHLDGGHVALDDMECGPCRFGLQAGNHVVR